MCFCARVNITTCVCVCECKYARESGRACSADRYRCSHVRVPISNDCKSGALGQYYYSCTNKHTHTSAQRVKRIHGTSDTYARTHTHEHTLTRTCHTLFVLLGRFFRAGALSTFTSHVQLKLKLRLAQHCGITHSHSHTHTCMH